MTIWSRPSSLILRAAGVASAAASGAVSGAVSAARRPAHTPAADVTAGLAAAALPETDGTAALDVRTEWPEPDAGERISYEVLAAARMVREGRAARILVCNEPGPLDAEAIAGLAARFGVRVEPVVRMGGGIDLAIEPIPARG